MCDTKCVPFQHEELDTDIFQRIGIAISGDGVRVIALEKAREALQVSHLWPIAALAILLADCEDDGGVNNARLSQVISCRRDMDIAEVAAFSRLCGSTNDQFSGVTCDAEFHLELRRIIHKYRLWAFFNGAGPGIEHRGIMPSAYDALTGEVRSHEMAQWRANYRTLSPERQIILATIVWLYRGGSDSVWLRRVPINWTVEQGVKILQEKQALSDWGALISKWVHW